MSDPARIAVGPQWLVTARDAEAILSAYGLTPVEGSLQAIGGGVNGNARVETVQGSVVIRVHRPWTTPERLASVQAAIGYLRSRGFPVPRVLPTPDGKSWVQLHDRLVEVLGYVPHDGRALTWEASEIAFEQLGLLHSHLAGYPSEKIVPPAYAAYYTPAQALAMLDNTEGKFQALSGEQHDAVTSARKQARDLLAKLQQEWQRYQPQLPTQVIHGDYGSDNVLLRGGRVVAVLDFDFMAERERVFDLAYSLYWTLDRLGAGDSSGKIHPEDLDRLVHLLRRYNRSAAVPLASAEIEALPLEMARVPLHWIAEAGYTPDPAGQVLAYARHLPSSRWLLRDRKVVSQRFANT